MNFAVIGLRHGHVYGIVKQINEYAGCKVVGAWEEDKEALELSKNNYVFDKYYDTLDALLSDKNVDAVVIGDCFTKRGSRVIAALEAGKHVYTDKPVCTSIDELDRIEKLIKSTNLKVGCELSLRHDAALCTAAKLVREGKIGTVRTVSFTGQHPLLLGSRASWYFQGFQGGTINDLAIHGIDALSFLCGSPYAKTVFARQWNQYAKGCPDFLDCAQFMGELENGAAVTADVSYSAPAGSGYSLPTYWRFTLFGDDGFIECRLGASEILYAGSSDKQAQVIAAESDTVSTLDDFFSELNGKPGAFDASQVIDSSRRTLDIQAFADKA